MTLACEGIWFCYHFVLATVCLIGCTRCWSLNSLSRSSWSSSSQGYSRWLSFCWNDSFRTIITPRTAMLISMSLRCIYLRTYWPILGSECLSRILCGSQTRLDPVSRFFKMRSAPTKFLKLSWFCCFSPSSLSTTSAIGMQTKAPKSRRSLSGANHP